MILRFSILRVDCSLRYAISSSYFLLIHLLINALKLHLITFPTSTSLIIKHLIGQFFELIIKIGDFLHVFIRSAIIYTQLGEELYRFSLLYFELNVLK